MKKILFSILCLISCFIVSDVNAAQTCEPLSPSREAIASSGSEEIQVDIHIIGESVKQGYFYKQQIGGSWALCLDMGKRSRPSFLYTPTILTESDLVLNEQIQIVRAYEFMKKYSYLDLSYVIAQIAVWMTMEGNAILDKEHLTVPVTSAYCQLFAPTVKDKTTCFPGGESYDLVAYSDPDNDEVDSGELISDMLDDFLSVNASYYIDRLASYNLAIYSSNSYNSQRLVALNKCTEPSPYACPDGSKGNEVTDCVERGEELSACQEQLCPNNSCYVIIPDGYSAECDTNNRGQYSETISSGNCSVGSYVSENGEHEKHINEYCDLFCLESGTQEFPNSVVPAISTGTYVIWPTSSATISSVYGNRYPLKFTGTKECYVELAPNVYNETTNIDTKKAELEADINNSAGRDWTFASGASYENSRTNGGCEVAYSNENGYCKSSFNAKNAAENAYDRYVGSQEYQNAVNEKNRIDVHNREVDICESEKNEEIRVCEAKCTGTTSQIRYCKNKCASDSRNCEPTLSLGRTERDILDEEERLDREKNDAVARYNACVAEKDKCNVYTNNVNKLVEFANKIRECIMPTISCSGSSCELYNFYTNVDLSWSDEEYGTIISDSQLEKTIAYNSTNENFANYGSVGSNQLLTKIKNQTNAIYSYAKQNAVGDSSIIKITMNAEVTYSLPNTPGNLLNNYVVTFPNGNIRPQTELPDGSLPFTTIGYSNLPISLNASPTTTYNLELTNIRYGDSDNPYVPDDYVCHYNVTETPPPYYVCPPDTNYAGRDLFEIMTNEGISYTEAVARYCNITNYACPDGTDLTDCINENGGDYFACYDTYCVSDDHNEYCPSPYQHINLTPCIENGHDYNTCYDMFCTGNLEDPDGYHCINSNGVDGEMDITSCVITKMSQGLSEQDAINACDALVCPIGGLRIIYRTISLENPFPGKNITGNIPDFNDDVDGRYPGSNWNNLELVRNHILTVTRQGRTYDGSNIYQEAEPLYEFILTTSTINAIREYNDQQVGSGGYSDFELDCKNNSTACVSSFVHDSSLSGLVSGVCANAVSTNNFYTCSGD